MIGSHSINILQLKPCFFFLPKQSHTHNFTTIPKRHLNPNPKKIPPKSFTPPLGPKFNQPSTIHQPITNPSPTHQLPYHPYHPEKKTQFSSSCSSKATALKKLPDPGVEDHAPKRRKSIVTRPQNAFRVDSRMSFCFRMGEIDVG